MHDNSTKNHVPHWFIYFIYIWPFDQNIWSFFIYSFLWALQFDQKLWSILTDFFYLHMTIRLKTRGLTDLFCLFLHDHSTQIYGPLSFIFFWCRTIWPKIMVLIDLFLLFTQIYMVLFHSFFLLWTTIWLKTRGFIDLFCLFLHDHLTKIYGRLSFILPFV